MYVRLKTLPDLCDMNRKSIGKERNEIIIRGSFGYVRLAVRGLGLVYVFMLLEELFTFCGGLKVFITNY